MAEVSGPDEGAGDRGSLRLRIAASAEGLAAAQPELRAFLDAAGVPGDVSDRAELLVEELVMNLAMHGLDGEGDGMMDLVASAAPRGCTLVFEDGGRAFDPTAGELRELPQSLAEAQPGGLGLVLLRRMTRELSYERLPAGRNRLRMVIA